MMENALVKIKKSKGFEDLPLPECATEGACAVDLHAAVDDVMVIHPGDRTIISAGISIAVPKEFEASIRPRSGLAWKKGITVLDAPGTIDSDYRGPVGVILINHGTEKVKIERGERIAQMLVSPVTRIHWEESELDETERGANGFGSTDGPGEASGLSVGKVDSENQSSTLQDAHDIESGVDEEEIEEGTLKEPRGDEHLTRSADDVAGDAQVNQTEELKTT
jgi:dUTP pyrophosphatase